jgi:hypothetical protein
MKITLTIISIGCLVAGGWLYASTNEAPVVPSAEIVDILRTNYVDRESLDEQSLDAATLNGLLKSLGCGAQILTEEPKPEPEVEAMGTNGSALARAEVISPNIGYIRIGDLQPASVRAVDEELKKFAAAKVTGYILDLRFADGTNYEAAAKITSRFIEGQEALFTIKRATGESSTFHALPLVQEPAAGLKLAPLILLVNEQTRGSAEALAAALRVYDRGIIIGNPSAGNPEALQNIKLADGRWLQVVTAKIVMPDGSSPFPNGLQPDVPVKIANTVEREAVLSATNITLTASLQPKTKKKVFSEAELVKAFNAGAMSLSEEDPAAGLELGPTNGVASAQTPVVENANVHDAVLERAVDIMKGIQVFSAAQ